MDDWKDLLQDFQRSLTNMPQALPSGTATRASQIATLGRLLTKNAATKVLLNIQIASMHLADIIKGVSNSGKCDSLDINFPFPRLTVLKMAHPVFLRDIFPTGGVRSLSFIATMIHPCIAPIHWKKPMLPKSGPF